MTVYSPAEDSYLLASALPEDLQGLKCLEIGTGSGFIAEKMLEIGAEKVTAVDINPEAVKQASQRLKDFENAEVFQSDMFQEIENSFDLIVFNPPYLPGEASEVGDEEIWSGGEKGTEVTGKFLEEASDHLNDGGEAFFIVSSLSDPELEEFDQESFEVVDSDKLWFETLYAVRFR